MEKRQRGVRDWAAYVICIAAGIAAAALFLKYIFGIVLPFLLAWGLALAARPLAAFVGRRTRIPNRVLRLVILLLLYAALCVGIWFGGSRLIRELSRLLIQLGDGGGVMERVRAAFSKLPFLAPGAETYVEDFLNRALSSLAALLPGLVGRLLSSVPRAVITAVVVLIASVYFSLDLEKIHAAIMGVLPEGYQARVRRLRDGVVRVGVTYVRAYLILMLLTAALLFVGFLMIRVEYALLFAFLISVVDLLPVLGVGTVLAPWSVWCFVTGAGGRAAALLVLWLVVLVVRQFAEPRILGVGLGVHPLLTLIAMYAGLALGGVWGMLMAPVLAVPVAALFKPRNSENSENKTP